jgi:hypothetical protein
MLAPVLSQFEEGLGTRDVLLAHHLLGELI